MAHPYPAHHDKLPYVGRHHYFLTFCTNRKEPLFAEPAKVELVRAQFLRAGSEVQIALTGSSRDTRSAFPPIASFNRLVAAPSGVQTADVVTLPLMIRTNQVVSQSPIAAPTSPRAIVMPLILARPSLRRSN
jgi:hypothetical protein